MPASFRNVDFFRLALQCRDPRFKIVGAPAEFGEILVEDALEAAMFAPELCKRYGGGGAVELGVQDREGFRDVDAEPLLVGDDPDQIGEHLAMLVEAGIHGIEPTVHPVQPAVDSIKMLRPG